MSDDGRNDAESEDAGTEAAEAPETELERTRKLILERRNRFMAAALAGMGVACGASRGASICLSLAAGSGAVGAIGGGGGTAASGSCPGRPWTQQPPCVCLSQPIDAGSFDGSIAPPVGGMLAHPDGGVINPPTAGHSGNSGISGTGGAGGTGGTAGSRPRVCLSAPRDEDAGTEPKP